jgi:hypothetical protein
VYLRRLLGSRSLSKERSARGRGGAEVCRRTLLLFGFGMALLLLALGMTVFLLRVSAAAEI